MVDTDYQLEFANKNFSESHKDHLPVIRIFGVTKNENSVCCKVHGFYPYFHLQQPPEVKTPRDLHDFIQTIEVIISFFSLLSSYLIHISNIECIRNDQ